MNDRALYTLALDRQTDLLRDAADRRLAAAARRARRRLTTGRTSTGLMSAPG